MKTWIYIDGTFKDAHAEIELLRGYRDAAEADAAVAHLLVDKLRLTDEEREVLEHEVELAEYQQRHELVATLRGLLERLGGSNG